MRAALRLGLVAAAAPLLLAIRLSPARDTLAYDATVWDRRIAGGFRVTQRGDGPLVWLAFLCLRLPEFRTLVYLRWRACGPAWRAVGTVLGLVYRPQVALS